MIADIDPRYPNELHLHALSCKPGPCLAPTRYSSIFSTSFCTCGLTRKHRARLLEDATIMFLCDRRIARLSCKADNSSKVPAPGELL